MQTSLQAKAVKLTDALWQLNPIAQRNHFLTIQQPLVPDCLSAIVLLALVCSDGAGPLPQFFS